MNSRPAQRVVWSSALLIAAIAFGTPSQSLAQLGAGGTGSVGSQSAPGSSMRGRLSPSAALRLLRSIDVDDQIRGVQRLGAQNDYAAIQVLLQTLADNPKGPSDARLCVEYVRALAPFASRNPVRSVLVSWMTSCSVASRSSPLADLASSQAAMALASSDSVQATEQLVLALTEDDVRAKRASTALIAHPPAQIDPFLLPSSLESRKVVELLGHMGDVRAVPALRKLLREADIHIRVAAAVSLARLGDSAGARLARDWISQDGSTHTLRAGAARVLTLVRDPLAPRAIAILLADASTREEGLSLAELAPTQQLAPTLAGLLEVCSKAERTRVLAALARCGGPLAAQTLGSLMRAGDHDAAFALAHCRGSSASDAISRALEQPSIRRLAARAAIVRAAEHGSEVNGFAAALRSLAASSEPADRFVGILGLVWTGRSTIKQHVESGSPFGLLDIVAACSASVAVPLSDREHCKRQLLATEDAVMRDSLAGALDGNASFDTVSTNTLLEWAESPSLSAPVFARLLGPRDSDRTRHRIERLLFSGDPDTRAQVAIGLGSSRQPSAVALLARAYAYEAEPSVRRAIVVGMSTKPSVTGRRWLALAEKLDPDSLVRSIARKGLKHASDPAALSSQHVDRMLWLSVASGSGPAIGIRPVRITLPSGFAVSAVAAPDGDALVPTTALTLVSIRADGASWSQYSPTSVSDTPMQQ